MEREKGKEVGEGGRRKGQVGREQGEGRGGKIGNEE